MLLLNKVRLKLANFIAPPSKISDSNEFLFGVPRSPQWEDFRNAWLKLHPFCIACGNRLRPKLQVHHLVPVHFPGGKEHELDPENVVTLCVDGPFNVNCHGMIGHGGNFADVNPNCISDAGRFFKMIKDRQHASD